MMKQGNEIMARIAHSLWVDHDPNIHPPPTVCRGCWAIKSLPPERALRRLRNSTRGTMICNDRFDDAEMFEPGSGKTI